jgi:O-antigen/teichoic acid export membrane protein
MKKILNQYKTMPIQIKATFWYVICSFFTKGIGFITIPFFTRLLSLEEYGECSLFSSWASIWDIFATLSLSSAGVFNIGMIKFEKDRKGFLASLQGLSCFTTIICLSVNVIFFPFFKSISGLNLKLIILIFVQILFAGVLNLWYAYQRYAYSYVKLIVVTLISNILGSILSLVLVFSANDKVFARFVGGTVVQAFLCIVLFVYEHERGKEWIKIKYWNYAIRFNVPLIPHNLSSVILNCSDKIMIGFICGEDKAALYGVVGSCSMIMTILLLAVNYSITPWYYEQLQEKKYSNLKERLNILVVAFGGVTILVSLLGPEVLKILATEEYYGAIYLIPVVMISVFFWFLHALFVNVELYYERTKEILIASIVAAALNIVLNIIFIPIFGYYAAGYTTLICYIIYAMIHYIFAVRIIKEKEISSIFNINILLFISLSMIIILPVICFMYRYTILRYTIVLLIIVLTMVFIKKLNCFKCYKEN